MNFPLSSNTGAGAAAAPARAILQSNTTAQNAIVESAANRAAGAAPTGYGLPCAKCRTYYSAALKSCPVCKTAERVSPTEVLVRLSAPPAELVEAAAHNAAGVVSDTLQEERERFLSQFQQQAYAPAAQINIGESSHCSITENHTSGYEPASVCQNCYGSLQTRADLMEAALHIDMKEAAQIIYDAVWTDPSDPGKTYQNAAQALISELHKRAGISAVLGPLQPLAH